jgi:hypothetical protein
MSDRAYAYAYGRLYIYGPLALEIDQSSQSTSQKSIQSNNNCYDMEVGENRVRVFYGIEKIEGERLEIYTGGIGPCSSTVYQTCNILYICNNNNIM